MRFVCSKTGACIVWIVDHNICGTDGNFGISSPVFFFWGGGRCFLVHNNVANCISNPCSNTKIDHNSEEEGRRCKEISCHGIDLKASNESPGSHLHNTEEEK